MAVCCNTREKESLSIPELARTEIEDLFSSEMKPSLWYTVIPKNVKSLKCTPSESDTCYSISEGCEKDVKDCLGRYFSEVFTNRAHVESFWLDFSMNLTHRLGLTYRETQKMNGTMSSYSEAKLRHHILNPILKEVSKAANYVPKIMHETIQIDYLIEDEIETEERKAGQKPAIDSLIQISDREGVVLALIPIEMKIDISRKHYSQIACYMNKLSTAKDIRGCIMVGIIIDKKQFRLAFSGFSVVDEREEIPLPVVHISPPIAWRSESPSCSIIHEHAMLVLLSAILVGQVKRVQYDQDKHHLDNVRAKTLIAMGKNLLESPHVVSTPKQVSITTLKRKLDEQEEEIEKLKKTVEKLQDEPPKTKKQKK